MDRQRKGVHTHKHTHEQPALRGRPVGSASLREVLLCFCFPGWWRRPEGSTSRQGGTTNRHRPRTQGKFKLIGRPSTVALPKGRYDQPSPTLHAGQVKVDRETVHRGAAEPEDRQHEREGFDQPVTNRLGAPAGVTELEGSGLIGRAVYYARIRGSKGSKRLEGDLPCQDPRIQGEQTTYLPKKTDQLLGTPSGQRP